MTITVYGKPGVQGSHKIGRGGKIVHDSAGTMPWRDSIKQAVMLAYPIGARGADPILHRGPVSVVIKFSLECPKRAKAGDWAAGRYDVDKLARCVLDPLTEMGVFEDDRRVVHLIATKRYCGIYPEVLPLPGAVIEVMPV
jgi:Holliday junction resolvase RusA-like endonuclease